MNRLVNTLGASSWVSYRVRRWLLVRGGAQIGDLRIGEKLHVSGDIARVTVGDGVYINVGARLFVNGGVTIGNSVSIGPDVLIMTGSHAIGGADKRASSPTSYLPVVIGAGTWIGARVTIQGGVTIGEGTVVAAGAVVTKDLPSSTLCAGVPARVIRNLL